MSSMILREKSQRTEQSVLESIQPQSHELCTSAEVNLYIKKAGRIQDHCDVK